MISAGVLEGTLLSVSGYSGDRFFVAESLVGVHYLKRGKLLNSILDIVLLLIFASACAFCGHIRIGTQLREHVPGHTEWVLFP